MKTLYRQGLRPRLLSPLRAPRGLIVRHLGALGALATGIVAALVACSSTSTDGPSPVEDASVDDSAVEAGDRDGRAIGDASVDDGNFVVPDASVVCEVSPCVTKLTGSADGFCALLKDGRASCWGANDHARLGDVGKTTSLVTPSIVKGLDGITHLGVSAENTCARVAAGSVYCWGQSDLVNAGRVPSGEEPPFGDIETPTRQDAVPTAESISVGARFACVSASDGALSCWGTNDQRELGRGATEPWTMAAPAKATLLTRTVAEVIAGSERTFVVTPDGDVLSWGANTRFGSENYLLGRDSSEDPNERPTLVGLLSRVRSIGTATTHSCAVAGRFVECWGSNSDGQLGRGGFEALDYLPEKSTLADVTAAEKSDASTTEHDVPVQVVASEVRSCAVLGSGRVYCWGNAGSYGLFGTQVRAASLHGTPLRIDGFSGPVVALAAGRDANCALLRSGAVECWGANHRGQLGTGAADSDPHPIPVRSNISQ